MNGKYIVLAVACFSFMIVDVVMAINSFTLPCKINKIIGIFCLIAFIICLCGGILNLLQIS